MEKIYHLVYIVLKLITIQLECSNRAGRCTTSMNGDCMAGTERICRRLFNENHVFIANHLRILPVDGVRMDLGGGGGAKGAVASVFLY